MRGRLWLDTGCGAVLLGVAIAEKLPAGGYEVSLLRDVPSPAPPAPAPRLTRKARDRYIEVYPTATNVDIYAAVRDGIIIDADMVDSLTGRIWERLEPPIQQTFVLCSQRTGIFVLSDRRSVVTYLHLVQEQIAFSKAAYPPPPVMAG